MVAEASIEVIEAAGRGLHALALALLLLLVMLPLLSLT